jgi:hypothetical protein
MRTDTMPTLTALGIFFFAVTSIAAQAPEPAAAIATAERAASEASGRDGLARALDAAIATDGVLLWPGAPVVLGRSQVHRLLAAQRLLDSLRITWQPLGIEVAADGALGITWGVAAVVRDGAAARLGRYIAAWRLDDGQWKLAAFVGLGIFPATATVLPPDLGPMRQPAIAESGPAVAFIRADLAFASLAGDSGAAFAFERFAAPDGFTLGSGLITRGPAAIRQSLEGGPPSQWSWHPVAAGASSNGDLGFTAGESEIRTDGAPTSYGKYLTIWRRAFGGAVRFFTDGGNARPPTP